MKRWRQFINDCGRFLDDGWASHAVALGWSPADLFGCDRHRPFARVDHAGLIWLLDGSRVIALTSDTAAIETRTGARQVYRRKVAEVGQVALVWELQSQMPPGE